MKYDTISKERFESLKPGDVILWGGRYLRTVVEGCNRPNGAVQFSKQRKGNPNYQAITTYFYNDVRKKIAASSRRIKTVISLAEAETVKALGWNPKRELVKIVRMAKENKIRMGQPLCNRKLVLP